MRLFKVFFLLLILTISVSCSNESEPEESNKKAEVMEEQLIGFVLHVEEKRFLMIDNEDKEVYKELEGLTMEEMLQGDPDIPLVYVNYPDVEGISKGDHIIVDYDGVMTFSIPGQINAAKVTQVE